MRFVYIALVIAISLLFVGAVLKSFDEVWNYLFYGTPIYDEAAGLLILMFGFFSGVISKDADKGFAHIATPSYTILQISLSVLFFVAMVGSRIGWNLEVPNSRIFNATLIASFYTALWCLMIIGPWNNMRGNDEKERQEQGSKYR